MFYIKSVSTKNNKVRVYDTIDDSVDAFSISQLEAIVELTGIVIDGFHKETCYSNHYTARKSSLADFFSLTTQLFKSYNIINKKPIINGKMYELDEVDTLFDTVLKNCGYEIPKINKTYSKDENCHRYLSVQKIFPLNNRLADIFPVRIYLGTPDGIYSNIRLKNYLSLFIDYFFIGKNDSTIYREYIDIIKPKTFKLEIEGDFLVISYKDEYDSSKFIVVTKQSNNLIILDHNEKVLFGVSNYRSRNIHHYDTFDKKYLEVLDNGDIMIQEHVILSITSNTIFSKEDYETEASIISKWNDYELVQKGNLILVNYPNGKSVHVNYNLRYIHASDIIKLVSVDDDYIVIETSNNCYYKYNLDTEKSERLNKYKYENDEFIDILTGEVLPVTVENFKSLFCLDNKVISDFYELNSKEHSITYVDDENKLLRKFNTNTRYEKESKSLYYVEYDEETEEFCFINYKTNEKTPVDFDYLQKCRMKDIQVDGAVGLVLLGKEHVNKVEREICAKYEEDIILHFMLQGIQLKDAKIKIDYPTDKFILDDRFNINISRTKGDYRTKLIIGDDTHKMAICELDNRFKKGDMSYYIMNNELYIGLVDISSVRKYNNKHSSHIEVYLYKLKDLKKSYSDYVYAYQDEFIDYKEIKGKYS